MASGLLFGLVAAIGWGLVDVGATIAARRFGPIVLATGVEAVGLVTFTVLAAARGGLMLTPNWLPAAVSGLVAATAYLSAFNALRIGPLAVVSPVMSVWGGLTVILAVLFRAETLGALDWVGVVLAMVGVVLLGLVLDDEGGRPRLVSIGVAFALLATVGFAVSTVLLAGPIQADGWVPITLISRVANIGLVLAVLAATLTTRGPEGAPAFTGRSWGLLAPILIIGACDTVATLSFSFGLETSVTWLVGLTSSFGPALAVLFAVGVLHERLRPVQWLGLALLGAAVVALALPG